MKKNILYSLVGLAVLFGMSACSEDRYETSVVKQIELFLNDDEWFVNVGINTKPLSSIMPVAESMWRIILLIIVFRWRMALIRWWLLLLLNS